MKKFIKGCEKMFAIDYNVLLYYALNRNGSNL